MHIPLVDLHANYLRVRSEIDAAIAAVIEQSSFIMGPYVKAFEEAFSKACGVPYAIGCSNGTSAVFLALDACGVKPGDEVILPTNTFIATSESVTRLGATPIFVDIDPATHTLSVKAARDAISPNTTAIIPVHIYGGMADMKGIMALAEEHNLRVVEDTAQAHFATLDGKGPGQWGDAATFSFFPAKVLGAFGDAGAVIVRDDKMARRVSMQRNHGRLDKYLHEFEGANERMDGLQAAILSVKLKHLTEWIDERRAVAARYDTALADLVKKGILTIPQALPGVRHVYYMYVIETERRDDLMAHLKNADIECGIHYPVPLHLQPAYAYLGYKERDFPNAETAAKRILSIPMYPELSAEQQDYIVGKIKEFFK
ncbi:MAG: DegT/DnrJ/EryC1/StrS family aminotransferase [Nanoarchaeota archaeon]